MFISSAEVLSILEQYKYFIIFPVAIVEGPIIIIISGFLAYLGYLNIYIAYFVLVVADTIGDSLYYTIGKYWRKWTWIKKYARFLGYNERSEAFLEEHFRRHKGKTFLIAKLSHGVGGAVQIASGIAGVRYIEFLLWSLIGTLPKALILFVIGFHVGASYERIDGYFDYIALTTLSIAVFILCLVFVRKYVKKSLSPNSLK